jgi:hypothetical protein
MELKIPLIAAVISSAIAPASATPQAQVDPAAKDVEYCREIIADYPGHPLGECIASFRSSETALAAKTCLFLKREGELWVWGYHNWGECVEDFSNLRSD